MEVLPRDCLYECIERIPRSSLWDCSMVNRLFRELCLNRTIKVDSSIDPYTVYETRSKQRDELDELLLKLCREGDRLSIIQLHPYFIDTMKCGMKYLIALGSQSFDPHTNSSDIKLSHPIRLIKYLFKKFGCNINNDIIIAKTSYEHINFDYLYTFIMRGAATVGNIELILWLNSLPLYKHLDKLKELRIISLYGSAEAIGAFHRIGIAPDEFCIQMITIRKDYKLLSLLASKNIIPYNIILTRQEIYKLINWSLDNESIDITHKWITGTVQKVYILNMSAINGDLRLVKTMFDYGMKIDKMVEHRAINRRHDHLLEFIKTWRMDNMIIIL